MEHRLTVVLAATFFSWAFSVWPVAESRATPTEVASLSKIVNGEFSLDDLYHLKTFFDDANVNFKQMLNFSPLLKSIVDQVAKRNIKAKILLAFFTGKTPSLDDIIKLATTKSEAIEKTLKYVVKTDPKWHATAPDQTKNHTAIKEALEMIAGRKIDVTSIKLKNDKYTVTERTDLAYYNLLKLFYFLGDNYQPFRRVMLMLSQKTPDYQAMLPLIINFNYTNFPTTTVSTNSQKYSVTYPEAANLLKDVKTKYPQILAQQDNKAVENAVLTFASVFIDMVGSSFSEAENLRQKEAANSKE